MQQVAHGCHDIQAIMEAAEHFWWQVELPGVGWLHSDGRCVARLELDEQLLQRLTLKLPLVSQSSTPACFPATEAAFEHTQKWAQ